MIVMKFGGTSVAGSRQLRNVSLIVARNRHREPVVITSAMAGVTDALMALIDVALSGQREPLEEGLSRLRRRHLETAEELSPGNETLVDRLERRLRELRVLLRGVRLVGTASPRSTDAVLGFGELLAQELLATALDSAGCLARVSPSTEVVVTDDHFGAAEPQVEATARLAGERVLPLVREGIVPVLGGYVGATGQGIPTTLGRGGSDLSASVLALALGAESVEIWTDVDGLMSADPRLVPDAATLPRVTFNEAAELAGFGANVLHPASIDPAIRGGLPVFVRNSSAPDRPGTLIDSQGGGSLPCRAVAAKEALAEILVRAPGKIREISFLNRILTTCGEFGLSPRVIAPGPGGVALLVDGGSPPESLTRSLASLGEISVTEELGIVAIVGEGMPRRADLWPGWLKRAADLEPRRVIQGPMGSSIGVVLPAAHVKILVRRWHEECLSPEEP